uniref:Serpin domain-containing protein n=1 Tax=Brassica campestris TaxID=3711 RepID=M4E6R2_BRACM
MDLREAMRNQNDVAVNLSMNVLSSATKDSNVIFSPASINSAITMHAAGPGGESSSIEELKTIFREISSVVFADQSASGGPKITAANGLWIEKSLSVDPKFKDLFENFFNAVYAPVDFRSKAEEVREEVNSWVENHTNNLIKDLLPAGSVASDTDKIYANALYFKGAWKRPFEKYNTRDRDFHLVNGTSVSVPFMTSSDDQYVRAYDGFKVLRLPYRRGSNDSPIRKFSMYFYLPDKKDGLYELLEKMGSTPEFVDYHIPGFRDELGAFRIPKFRISFGFSVSTVLDQLGMRSISLYHKACVEIDEEGAEAAAATADDDMGFSLYMEPPKRIDFVADHPFLFLIREDKTGTVLFFGQIFDPSQTCWRSVQTVERSIKNL